MAVLDTNFQTIELGDVAWHSKLNANFQYLNHYENISSTSYSCDTANANIKDYIIGVDAATAGGNVTISLPKLNDNEIIQGGRTLHIIKVDSGTNHVDIQTDSTATTRDKLNGSTTATVRLLHTGERVTIFSAGKSDGWFGKFTNN